MEQTIEHEVNVEGQEHIDMNLVPAPSMGLRSSDIEKLLLESPDKGKYSFVRYM